MSSTFQNVPMGEVATFKTGKLDSNAAVENGAYPFFTCSRDTFRTNTYSFDDEVVLLAGNNANGIYPLKYFKGKFDAYQRTYVIRAIDEKRLDTRFLYFALRPQLDHLRSVSTGSATKFLTMGLLSNLEMPLPDLPTQRKIAGILSAYDDLIENNLRRIKILEQMAQSLYREWFVHFRFPGHDSATFKDSELGRIPEGWELKKVEQILELKYGKALKKGDRREGQYPVFGSSGIVGTHDTCLTNGPGIVVGRKGNVGSVFWSDEDFYVIDTAYFVQSHLPLRFLFYLLPTLNFINSDAAVPGLSRKQAYTLEALVPPSDLLIKFCTLADGFEKQASVHRRQNQTLRRTRDLLLPKLLSPSN